MAKYISTKRIEIDSIPGSLQLEPHDSHRKSTVSCIEWTLGKCTERSFETYNPKEWDLDPHSLHWINIAGHRDKQILENIGSFYKIHPLTIEDIFNTEHAPKYEDNLQYGFIVIKMLRFHNDLIAAEQLSVIFTSHCVITIQEDEEDVFALIRERLIHNLGRIRQMGTDYLVFSLLDAIIDHYVLTVEKLGENVEVFEDEIFRYHDEHVIRFVRKLKRDFADIRRFTRPVIGIIEQLLKSEQHICEKSHPFYHDLKDQIRLVTDAVDGYREMLSDQLGIYTALQGNRMNEIMKVLAIISTIFIPLTFIAGVYGMNFRNMPELTLSWTYPLVIVVMIVLAIAMSLFFRMKGWIGKRRKRRHRRHISTQSRST